MDERGGGRRTKIGENIARNGSKNRKEGRRKERKEHFNLTDFNICLFVVVVVVVVVSF